MKRSILLGGWYALAIAGLIAADDFRVTVKSASIFDDADPWANVIGSLEFGTAVTTSGPSKTDFLPVTVGGKSGWISRADLVEPDDFKAGSAGSAAGTGQEGAYVKGFDPEVEKKSRAGDAAINAAYENDVLPMIWETRGHKELEIAEEALEELQIQAKGTSPEADALRARIEVLRREAEPIRSKWQAALRAFRQSGRIGEFAGGK